jgi:hypothetical protein
MAVMFAESDMILCDGWAGLLVYIDGAQTREAVGVWFACGQRELKNTKNKNVLFF